EIYPLLTPEQKKRLGNFIPWRLPFRRRAPIREITRELIILKDKLGLNQEQVFQIRRILEETASKMRMPYRGRRSLEERRSIMEKLKEEKEKAIEKILTEDQKKLYEQLKKDIQR
ncbi:MAG: hypothetical protein ACE5GI_08130, partial [Candidatus Aminicenantales bacterium]